MQATIHAPAFPCTQCEDAKRILHQNGIPFKVVTTTSGGPLRVQLGEKGGMFDYKRLVHLDNSGGLIRGRS